MSRHKNIDFDSSGRSRQLPLNHTTASRPTPLLGLIVMAVGCFPLLVGLQVIKPAAGSVHAPLWILAAVGVTFIGAGLSVLLQAIGLPKNSPINAILAILIILGMLTPFAWIVLGPSGAGIIGRLLFGMPFAIVLLLLAAVFLMPGEMKIIDPQTGEVRKIIRLGKFGILGNLANFLKSGSGRSQKMKEITAAKEDTNAINPVDSDKS